MSLENIMKYVVFKLNDEYYGIPINNVLSIERMAKVTRIPNAPNYVEGVFNLRGEVVPIVNLKTKLGMENSEIEDNSRIVILSKDEIILGVVADSSSEVLEINKESIDKPPIAEDNQYIEYIDGIGKVSGRLIILLNLSRILKD